MSATLQIKALEDKIAIAQLELGKYLTTLHLTDTMTVLYILLDKGICTQEEWESARKNAEALVPSMIESAIQTYLNSK